MLYLKGRAMLSNEPCSERRHFPLILRFCRLIFGKMKPIPKAMSTVLVLCAMHMYFTVPILLAAGLTSHVKAVLNPFKQLYNRGYDFEELANSDLY
uniref:Transmembrane protein n=1 Tax=Steinernema glaseri TaxID=37863 RepID=A0A1I7YGL2_9BILA